MPALVWKWIERLLIMAAVAAILLRFRDALGLEDEFRSGVFPDDFYRFWELARTDGTPYLDYEAEYPIVTVLLLRLIGSLTDSFRTFSSVLLWLNVLADAALVGVLYWAWGRMAAAFYLVSTLWIVSLIDLRLDVLSAFVAVLALALWVRDRPASSGAAVGLAALVKLWPAWLALLGVARGWRNGASRRFTVGVACAGGALTGLWLAIGRLDGVRQVLSYRGAKGWEIETIPGLILLELEPGRRVFEGGASRIGEVSPLVRLVLVLASLSIAAWAAVRSGRVERYGAGWMVAVSSLLLFSPLLSPQFLIWLLPGAAIAWVEGDRMLALTGGTSAWLTGIEIAGFESLLKAHSGWIALTMARNLVLGIALVVGLRALLSAAPPVAARAPASTTRAPGGHPPA